MPSEEPISETKTHFNMDTTNEIKITQPKMQPNYPRTLRAMKVGEIISLELRGGALGSFHAAKRRLAKEGYGYNIELDSELAVAHITRTA